MEGVEESHMAEMMKPKTPRSEPKPVWRLKTAAIMAHVVAIARAR